MAGSVRWGDAGPSTAPRPAPRRLGWSVRAHLVAIAGVVVVVFAVAGSVAAREVRDGARENTGLEAASLVAVAADLVADNVELGRGHLSPLAANAGLPTVLAQPGSCSLDFALDLFPGGRLDIVRPDGTVACSSHDNLPAGASHAGAAWLADLFDRGEEVRSRVAVDAPTGVVSAVFGVPVTGQGGGLLGAVVMVLPTAGVGDRLADVLGGPRGFDFALVDGPSGALLSASTDLDGLRPGDTNGGPDPLEAAGFISDADAVSETSWRLVAGLERSAALARANAVLLRGGLVGVAVLSVLVLSLLIVYQRIALPLRRLTEAVARTGWKPGGVLDLTRGPAEVVELADNFRAALATRESFEDQLLHQALHDPLTGLANRALLAERLAHSLEQSSRSRTSVAVLFLDLDRFKLVNASLGHAVGDQVLHAIARRLRDIIRPGDTLARFGGDEFVVVAEAVADRAQAERLAERLLSVVQSPVQAGSTTVRVTASIGIALSDRASNAADLVSDADNAMYLAKERGRSRHEVFDLSLRDRVTTRLTVANELRGALDRDDLHLVYQPQIDLTTGTTVGVEALVRWDHPGLGAIPPATFIPIAEDTGSIVPLGRFVLEQACRQAASWQREGYDLTVSVNLSGRQLGEAALVDDVERLLGQAGLDPSTLCLELTESVLMSDTPRATEALTELHELGVQLSIDDFGTGYSSLSYLHRFPVDHLKIDRTFVQGLGERSDQRDLVRAMVAMGSAMGLQVVAEGVETPQQAEELRLLGCHTAQGFLFAVPQRPGPLGPMLRRSARTTTTTTSSSSLAT